MKNLRDLVRWTSIAGAAVSLLLLVLNVPFYAGSTGRHMRWRMEHGRLTMESSSPEMHPQGFWVAANSEGLKWKLEIERDPQRHTVIVPLWIPLVLCGSVAATTWRPGRRHRTGA